MAGKRAALAGMAILYAAVAGPAVDAAPPLDLPMPDAKPAPAEPAPVKPAPEAARQEAPRALPRAKPASVTPDVTLPATPRPKPQAADPAAADLDRAAFEAWLTQFRSKALAAGIAAATFDEAMAGVAPNPKVQTANEEQPELNRQVWDYLDGALNRSRIENGRLMLKRYVSLLGQVERKYGIPKRYVVAIWGMETSYGKLLGKHNIFQALATLSYEGRRKAYGEEQLIAAMKLLARGDKPASQMRGSWAGAVGHTQFVPTTYLKYAVDHDGDGRRDLWDSLGDVFASTAHYLAESGWQPHYNWGREVILPKNFDYELADYHVSQPVRAWRAQGVKMANGRDLPAVDLKATIIAPAGHRGPAFLVYENFQVILDYNRSTHYALGIALLADQLQGGSDLKASWPRDLRALTSKERIELQQRLAKAGYDPGSADGILGADTRKALRGFQKDRGLIADGFATVELLEKLRALTPDAADTEEDDTAQAPPTERHELAERSGAPAAPRP